MKLAMELHFEQPTLLKRRYEISDEHFWGSLVYPSVFSGRAIITIGDKQWQVKKAGILSNSFVISPVSPAGHGSAAMSSADESEDRKTGQPLTCTKDTVVLDKQKFTFKRERSGLGLTSKFVWTDQADNSRVSFAIKGFFKRRGEIRISTDQLSTHQQLLIPLGLFLGLNKDDDESSVAAA